MVLKKVKLNPPPRKAGIGPKFPKPHEVEQLEHMYGLETTCLHICKTDPRLCDKLKELPIYLARQQAWLGG